MFSFLSDFLKKYHIDCVAPIALRDCKIVRPYLLEREGIPNGTVFLMAIPYYTSACDDPARNISAYAVARDYHAFFRDLFDDTLDALRKAYPQYRFAGFSDHSPIAEVDAAARAGLGIIGKNNLLITKKYSSYVFLGEIITDALLECNVREPAYCEMCGACTRHCPMQSPTDDCLSALTQKKGELTDAEAARLLDYGFAWGCDLCQEACPHTKRAKAQKTIYSPIPYFAEDTIPHLTKDTVTALSDEAFAARAFSWRGRHVILRNLDLLEEHTKGERTC